jgi:biotin-(acetyl-CoA carboxylase) ligase
MFGFRWLASWEAFSDRAGGDRDAQTPLVVGVGNHLHLDEAMRRSIGQPVIALDHCSTCSRPAAARAVDQALFASAIFGAAARFMRDGFDPFARAFNQLLEFRGECVDVLHDGPGVRRGPRDEVDRQPGRLIVEAQGHRHAISVGDVSVRQ